ncbi:MAG: amino acid ABC transporter permease [Thermoleophilia bacterium]|nr:amino acid ABC transporter permease [Thermoleophilia bacterium]
MTGSIATNATAWAKENLFRNWRDAVLTVVFGLILAFLTIRVLSFVLGSDWEIQRVNMRNSLVGPEISGTDLWGPVIGIWLGAAAVGVLIGAMDRAQHVDDPGAMLDPLNPAHWPQLAARTLDRLWPLLALVAFSLLLTTSAAGLLVAIATLALGFLGRAVGMRLPLGSLRWAALAAGLAPLVAVLIIRYGFGIDWKDWGGFLLVAFAGAAGIALSFPLGILLALGRRSKLPAIKALSVAYIEFFRGVPLVVLLLIGSLVIGLFLPRSLIPSEAIRAVIIFTLFTAAYFAEVIRGGLQSLPAGQEEAAKALGLPGWRITTFIVMPQALRNVIPAIVGQSISLWKDTSLMFIIGLAEPLRLASAFTRQPEFRGQGLITLTLFFAGLIYWVVSFTMSRESQRLERKLGVGQR